MPMFNPPDSFQFDKPADWPEWKQRFLRFRTATKLDRKTPTAAAAVPDADNFDLVMKRFDAYFIPKRNVIHECAKFHLHMQQAGANAESFYRSLMELSTSRTSRTTKTRKFEIDLSLVF